MPVHTVTATLIIYNNYIWEKMCKGDNCLLIQYGIELLQYGIELTVLPVFKGLIIGVKKCKSFEQFLTAETGGALTC